MTELELGMPSLPIVEEGLAHYYRGLGPNCLVRAEAGSPWQLYRVPEQAHLCKKTGLL